jgi:hypothetical protein
VQGYFESYWNLETGQKAIRFGERDTKASLLDLASRMLAVLYREREPEMEIVGVEQPFDVPLIDLDPGEVLDRALVGTLDLLERDAAGGLVVVDLKTSARKYSDLQVEASLQFSVYSYATQMNGLADEQDLRLRFDVLTKTKQPELRLYWTDTGSGGERAAVPAGGGDPAGDRGGGVPPETGVAVQGLPVPESVLGVAVGAGRPGEGDARDDARDPEIGKSQGERLREGCPGARSGTKKREARYDRVVRPLDRRRDALTVEVATRLRALSGGQRAAAQRLLAMITQATASDGATNRG